jgi:hypothetical protein
MILNLTSSPTELTTGATDALLAVECVVMIACLQRIRTPDRWRTGLWSFAFGLMAVSSLIGAVVHGMAWSNSTHSALWACINLCLGLLVPLFPVGAVYDWRGRNTAKRLIPWSIGVGIVFFSVIEFLHGKFIFFLVFEAAATVGALALYSSLAVTRRLKGAGFISGAILLNLAAAVVQAGRASVRMVFPFDHNGIYHLVQIAAIGILGFGLKRGMSHSAE